MATGKIKTIKRDKGFGFIRPDDGGKDIFFHMSSVSREPGFDFNSMTEGQEVEYDEGESDKGPRAENVSRA